MVMLVSVSSKSVRVGGRVDTHHAGGKREVALVLDGFWRRIVVVVPAVAVQAEPVEMLHAQIQILRRNGVLYYVT